MIRIRLDALVDLVPNAADVYLRALPSLPGVLACFGLLANEKRPAHFLAQVLHESGGFRVLEENLNYTTTARLMEVWPSRFPNEMSAIPFLRNPEGLAEKVYGGRVELGNLEPGDGWRFRGRGLIQITGRHNYRTTGLALDLDLLAQPELVVSETYAWPVAAFLWRQRGANRVADLDDLRAVTKTINGGYVGLSQRAAWLAKTRALVEEV